MNMQRETAKPDIFNQAEYWFVRLHDEHCSPQERMAFRQWRADPECAEAFAATEALWEDIGSVEDRPEIRELSEEVLFETQPPRTTGHKPQATKWAVRPMSLAAGVAAIAVALGSALLLYDPNAYTTGLGEQQTVALADGSTVILNTETRIEVEFTETARALRLVRGEALFDVDKDPRRPFQVTAGDSRVVALGTRFQVRRDADRVKVTLLEGQVEIQKAKAPDEHTAPYALRLEPDILLAPGEQVTIAKAQQKIVREQIEDKEAVVSWTNGRLVFRATPLEEAVAEVNRYARTKLRIADPALADLPISGTFVTGDSEILAAALETDFPVRAEQTGRREIVLYRQPRLFAN